MSIALIAVCTMLAATDEGKPVGGDYGQPRLLIAAPENPRFSHLAWPKVCQTKDGTLVVAFVAARAHTLDGCPAVSVSTDGGTSFTRPHILKEFDSSQDYAHCGNVALGAAEDGSVVVLAMAFTGDTRNTVFGWRSTDSGNTWQPVDTSALADDKTGSVFGRIFPVPGKGLVALGHYRPPSEPSTGIWMSVSQDHGRTWGPPRLVVPGRYYEPAAVFAAGRFIALLRNGRREFRWRYDQAVSDNPGERWQITAGAIAVAPESRCSLPSPFIAVSGRDPTRLYALQSERGTVGDSRGRIYLCTADAKTLKWKCQGLVVSIPKAATGLSDWSYPWMTSLDGDKWFLVFYAGRVSGRNSIWAVTIP